MQTLHTTEFHRLLGTSSVELDLGATVGVLADIKNQVGKLDGVSAATGRLQAIDTAASVTLPNQVDSLHTLVDTRTSTVLSRLGHSDGSLLADVEKALKAAADDIVERIGVDPQPLDFQVGTRASPLVRLLVQAQAFALARSPGPVEEAGDENVAMRRLKKSATAAAEAFDEGAAELRARFIKAFDTFDSIDLPSRSRRFVAMHALISEIALHFDGE